MQTRLITILCLLFCFSVTTRAQDELTIKSFEPRAERVIPKRNVLFPKMTGDWTSTAIPVHWSSCR